MVFKNHIITIALILLIIPSVVASVSITDTIQKFEETADRYDNGEISLPQMIVILEHHHDEKQRKMKEENFPGWSKSEIEKAMEEYKYPFGYQMKTHDMYIFMGTWSDDDEHYNLGYSVGGRKFPKSYLENEFEDDIEDLVQDLRNWFENREPSASEVGKKMESVFAVDSEVDSYEECIDIVEDMNVVKEINKDDLPEWYFDHHSENSRIFSTLVHQESEEECISSHNCGEDKDCIDNCRSDTPRAELVIICARDISPMDKEPVLDITLIHNGHKAGIDYHETNLELEKAKSNHRNNKCEPWGYDGRIYFRQKLQESLNKEFFDWYVEDFLGDDIEKHLDPTSSFERLMGFLHRNAQKISESLQCKGEESWPDEFEKINVDYEKGNTEFHIWEELKSVDHKDVDMWSTLYKYRIMGDKDLMKKLIRYQLSDKNTIEPPKNEIEKVKQKEEAMEILDKLVSGFGDSLDANLVLEDDTETVVTRYITINDDIIVKISDEKREDAELDFTATLTLDDMHDFAKRMSSMDAETVYGPPWVGTKEPMMIRQRIGLMFKLWNSVDVDPWTTKLKLSTKITNILNYLKSIKPPQTEEEEKMLKSLATEVNEQGEIKQTE